MPCRDYYDDHPEAYFKDIKEPALKKQIAFAESALCQTLAALEIAHTDMASPAEFYDLINFKEAGITKVELKKWHKEHKVLDAKHRKEESEKNLRATALAKLTAEERKALGVK
jgi:hypothetical protein